MARRSSEDVAFESEGIGHQEARAGDLATARNNGAQKAHQALHGLSLGDDWINHFGSRAMKRQRGRHNGRKPHHHQPHNPNLPIRSQTFDSNGPDVRVRGNAFQILEKYVALARDAQAAGDRIAAENYYQHAEHYYRLINESGGYQQRQNPNYQGQQGQGGQQDPRYAGEAQASTTQTHQGAGMNQPGSQHGGATVVPSGYAAAAAATGEGQQD
jgi:hypothetical protein